MNALSRPIATIDGAPLHLDLLTHLDFCRRVRELNELAAAERLTLPMPATWIATLETLGYTVDLATGKWADASGAQYWPTEAAYNLATGGDTWNA